MLEIKNLKAYYKTKNGYVKAVDGVNFSLGEGENLGLVGESGCGKTTMAKAIMRLLPKNASYKGGQILFKGKDILKLKDEELNRVRWESIAMVTQSAMNALDPVYRVGDQIVEAIQIHRNVSNSNAYARARELFKMVGLEQKRLAAYPHELSGGMKQRVVIAMALALEPNLLIADEPTTALDVVVQDGILKQLNILQKKLKNAMVMVTHDISVVAETCHKVVVMYGGKVMEYGSTQEVLNNPSHPYTMGLKNAFPTLDEARGELISIPGVPPDLSDPPEGCRFMERCPFSTEKCQEEPGESEIKKGHFVFCHYFSRAKEFRNLAKEVNTWRKNGATNQKKEKNPQKSQEKIVLRAEELHRWFPMKKGFLNTIKRAPTKSLKAVDNVSFQVKSNEILGLAGESGSGKSTLGEMLCHLQPTNKGKILYANQDVSALKGKKVKEFRKNFQMVFQDPYETLNPRFTVFNTIMEPLKIHKIGETEEERIQMVKQALTKAELVPPEKYFLKYPHQLSGGQRQRIALARAIALNPRFIIADEPVSMLDVSIRAGVLNLLRSFREDLGVSIIYISHDLATIRYICDRIGILYLGRILEIGPTEEVIQNPQHPYTKMLIQAVPRIESGREPVNVEGEIPDPINLPNGCRFHPRCAEAGKACGWEGKDLEKFLIRKKELTSEASPGEPFLDLIHGFYVQELDLKIKVKEGIEQVRDNIIRLLQEEKPALFSAIKDIELQNGSIYFSFAKKEEYPLRQVEGEHFCACSK